MTTQAHPLNDEDALHELRLYTENERILYRLYRKNKGWSPAKALREVVVGCAYGTIARENAGMEDYKP